MHLHMHFLAIMKNGFYNFHSFVKHRIISRLTAKLRQQDSLKPLSYHILHYFLHHNNSTACIYSNNIFISSTPPFWYLSAYLCLLNIYIHTICIFVVYLNILNHEYVEGRIIKNSHTPFWGNILK